MSFKNEKKTHNKRKKSENKKDIRRRLNRSEIKRKLY